MKTDKLSPPNGMRFRGESLDSLGKHTGLEPGYFFLELRSLKQIKNIKKNYYNEMKIYL